MPTEINSTHDPNLRSWVESANDPATDFPLQNLPLGTFQAEHDGHAHTHLGMAIGDQVLDITMLVESGYFDADPDEDLKRNIEAPMWTFMGAASGTAAALRRRMQSFLRADAAGGQSVRRLRQKALRPMSEVEFGLPALIFDYTDFYASIHHATTVGAMFRPDNPLLPNYKWVPIGYHGRASSITPSGRPIARPRGQTKADDAAEPVFGPCRLLDYELEVGAIISHGNPLGSPIPLAEAEDHVLGLVLVNDWSARDIQKWEYQPLGPFLSKNFGTTVSPWMVTLEALAPFRIPAYTRPAGDPKPLDYLRGEHNEQHGGFDITLEVSLASKQMRDRGLAPVRLSRGSFRDMYWTFAQLIAHHTSGGCNLRSGDLLASGTVSGSTPGSRGCLLELTWDGPGKPRRPVELPTGEKRVFLEDGDEIIMRGWCEREGFRRIGFGECRAVVEPPAGPR